MLSIAHVNRFWFYFCLAFPLAAAAQDRIVLEEVVPALANTEMGAIDVGPAPAPGMSRVVSRSEVLAALRKARRSSEGLKIPRSSRIERVAREIAFDEFIQLARQPIEDVLEPCEVQRIYAPEQVVVPAGPLTIIVEGDPPVHGRGVLAVVIMQVDGRQIRVPVRVSLSCPPPIVRPGSPVRIVVRIGNVVASTPGEARQAGRERDIIRVTRQTDRTIIRARVIDGETVEVVNR